MINEENKKLLAEKAKILKALDEASMCWSNIKKAGIFDSSRFDSSRCEKICHIVVSKIKSMVKQWNHEYRIIQSRPLSLNKEDLKKWVNMMYEYGINRIDQARTFYNYTTEQQIFYELDVPTLCYIFDVTPNNLKQIFKISGIKRSFKKFNLFKTEHALRLSKKQCGTTK